MQTKAKRIEIAQAAMEAFLEKNGSSGDASSDLQDLICDLMHLAANEKADPYRMVETAVSHYIAESRKDPALPVNTQLTAHIRKPLPKTSRHAGYENLWTQIHPRPAQAGRRLCSRPTADVSNT